MIKIYVNSFEAIFKLMTEMTEMTKVIKVNVKFIR